MTIRERLLEIPELMLAKRLIQMNDHQLNEYIQALNSFVERFPERDTELRAVMRSEDYGLISRCLSAIREMLVSIYADDLAAECLNKIYRLKSMRPNKLEAYLLYFLTAAATLSIDIQMAVYTDQKSEEETPDKAVDEATQSSDKSEQPANEPEHIIKSILAVDDKPFFLDMLKKCFQDTHYKLICVTSGKAALSFLRTHRPDLFILDIEMPRMNGYELAKKIKHIGQKAPIIFLTANATKEYVLRAIEAGAADFIVKPINQKQAIERIGKLI